MAKLSFMRLIDGTWLEVNEEATRATWDTITFNVLEQILKGENDFHEIPKDRVISRIEVFDEGFYIWTVVKNSD